MSDRMTVPLWGEATGNHVNKPERVSMSWRHHESWETMYLATSSINATAALTTSFNDAMKNSSVLYGISTASAWLLWIDNAWVI